MSNLAPSQLYKYQWRVEKFLEKYKNNEEFSLLSGDLIKFEYSSNVYCWLENQEISNLKGKIFYADDGNHYGLSDLAKTSEFGGKGSGFGVRIENSEISNIKKFINGNEIPIKVGNNIITIVDIEKTPGTPKSDFHLISTDNKEAIWISHKAGKKVTDFQQFGGCTEQGIIDNPEVVDFIETAKKHFPNGIPNKTSVARPINDNELKLKSVYGIDYGKILGQQNVSLLVQGNMKLEANGGFYSVNAAHVHINGEIMSNTYDPTLFVCYKGDRNQFGIKGARFSISPYGSRKINYMI